MSFSNMTPFSKGDGIEHNEFSITNSNMKDNNFINNN